MHDEPSQWPHQDRQIPAPEDTITIVSTRTTDRVKDRQGTVHEVPGGPARYVGEALTRLGREFRLITGLHVVTEVIEGPNGEEYIIPPLPPIPLPDPLVGKAVILSPITQEIIPEQVPEVRGLLVVDLQGFVRVPGKPSAHPGKLFDLREILSRADLVKASTAELALLNDASRVVLQQTVLVETRGRWGAVVHAGGESTIIDAQYVPVQDTIGAGDTFLAALVDAFTSGKNPVEAATAAARFTETVLRERLAHESDANWA